MLKNMIFMSLNLSIGVIELEPLWGLFNNTTSLISIENTILWLTCVVEGSLHFEEFVDNLKTNEGSMLVFFSGDECFPVT